MTERASQVEGVGAISEWPRHKYIHTDTTTGYS